MIAIVSIAARESFLVSLVNLVSSHDRSEAVRNVHFLPTRTRLTPRVAYSAFSAISVSRTLTPAGRRRASCASSSGAAAANKSASSKRSSSARAWGSEFSFSLSWSLSCTITSFFAALGIELPFPYVGLTRLARREWLRQQPDRLPHRRAYA